MVTAPVPDTTWSSLSGAEEDARQRAMAERFRHLAATEEVERLRELEAMVRAEYTLPDPELHSFTRSRLRAWISLREQDPGQASALARAYDVVFRRVPGELAMKRAAVVQTVARTEFNDDEVSALEEMVPSLVQSIAHSHGSGKTDLRARSDDPPSRAKPRWKFW